MSEKNEIAKYIWRISASHVIAYFIAGILAYNFMNYREHYASDSLSLLMRPTDSPWVALGPSLQILRGIIIALALMPFRSVFLNSDFGALKLAGLILGLSFVSTVGPTPGSFEGYIYTILPVQYHLLGIPETLVYVGVFVLMIHYWHKSTRRIWNILVIVAVLLIILMSIMGYLAAVGLLKTP